MHMQVEKTVLKMLQNYFISMSSLRNFQLGSRAIYFEHRPSTCKLQCNLHAYFIFLLFTGSYDYSYALH